jgi:hypothetical protein
MAPVTTSGGFGSVKYLPPDTMEDIRELAFHLRAPQWAVVAYAIEQLCKRYRDMPYLTKDEIRVTIECANDVA